ncbi:MAG: alkaline phosphatase [Spirochaetes bacterium]|nr:alkaline phosphatase [Spirochaetota bacterium]
MKKLTVLLTTLLLTASAINVSANERPLFTPFTTDINFPNIEIRNIIFMIPDGMDANGVTIARWLKAFEPNTGYVDLSARLRMDEIISGKIRSYWTDGVIIGGIADSAPAATSMATGYLTNNRFLGVTHYARPVANVLQAAQFLGKSTGLIATSNIQHATPAGFSAHHVERNRYDIIGEQQVYGNIDVVLGAGLQFMAPPFRQDGENLIDSLVERGYQFVTTREEMLEVTEGRLWGLFAPHFMLNEIDRHLMPDQPSLAEMTETAISLLSQNENGFFLMVEGSKIDWAAHGNEPVALMSEILAFDEAVGVALDFARQCGRTMILIASDHGTGGVTMGNRQTTGTYHSDPLSRFIAPLARASGSFESVFFMTAQNSDIFPQVMYSVFGIDDLSDEELAALQSAAGGYIAMRETVGTILSARINIGWTSGGHVGNDPTFYSFLPGNQRLVGLFSLTDMARMVEIAWNVDLSEVTALLFNDAQTVFEARGATLSIDDTTPSGAVMTVSRGGDVLLVPENKDYVYFNGGRVYFSINVFSAGRFFVNREMFSFFP